MSKFRNIPILSSGFTLLELLIVVAIAGILGAIAAPSFTDLLKNNRLTSKSNELLHGISLARQIAIGKNVVAFVCHSANADTSSPGCAEGTSSDWTKGYLIYNAPKKTLIAGDRDYAATDTLSKQIALSVSDNIIISSADNDNTDDSNISGSVIDHISFNSDGTLFSATPVTLQICDDRTGESGTKIHVNSSGRISMRPYTCT